MEKSYLFNHPLDASPPTWGEGGALNERIVARLEELLEDFRAKGIEWRSGIEQEFILSNNESAPERVEAERARILGSLAAIDDPAAVAKIAEVEKFTAGQLTLYQLHEQLPEALEYRFGKEGAGRGYYDGDLVFEVRTSVTDPLETIARYHQTLEQLQDIANSMGMDVELAGRHVNVSAWKDDKNLMQTGEREDAALRFNSGMVQAVYDNILTVQDDRFVTDVPSPAVIGAGPARSYMLRHGSPASPERSRMELRASQRADKEHLANTMLTMIGGAHAALEGAMPPDAPQSRIAEKGRFQYEGDREDGHRLAIRRALKDGTLDEEGHLHIPAATFIRLAEVLEKELRAMFPANIEYFFKETHVDAQGKIHWGDLGIVTDFSEEIHAEILDRISFKGRVPTLLSETKPQPRSLEKALENFSNSEVLQHVYGEELHAELATQLKQHYLQRDSGIEGGDAWEVQGKSGRTGGRSA